MADKDQKTQDPTDKKLEDARKKGDVASSTEMRHGVMFGAAIIVAGGMGSWTIARMGPMLTGLWGNADDYPLEPHGAQAFATGIFGAMFRVMGPILALLFGFALMILFLQGRPTLSWSRVTPKFSKLSPITGLGKMFGKRALVEFAKTLAKLTMVITIVTVVVRPRIVALDQLIGAEPLAIAATASAIARSMIKAVAMLVAALVLVDVVYQRRSFLTRMKMSLQEVKDEHKQSEGDPKIKAKIRAIGIQRARRRMMAAVPTASVIVTNPTHYAVALKYEHGAMAAPVVVAKGVDFIAAKIREIAEENKIVMVENRPLARALYDTVDIDSPVPAEHYKAVAEVISYVFRLKGKIKD